MKTYSDVSKARGDLLEVLFDLVRREVVGEIVIYAIDKGYSWCFSKDFDEIKSKNHDHIYSWYPPITISEPASYGNISELLTYLLSLKTFQLEHSDWRQNLTRKNDKTNH